MSEPFLAEITIVGFNFAPRGYALCDGQILPINQNQALYSLLGTTYGGDGRTTFGLPDLRGRTPMSPGTNGGLTLNWGQKGGEETHTLLTGEMPTHTHTARGTSSNANSPVPGGGTNAFILAAAPNEYHDSDNSNTPLRPGTTSNAGLNEAHDNMSPYLALNFCIALQGTFPSRN